MLSAPPNQRAPADFPFLVFPSGTWGIVVQTTEGPPSRHSQKSLGINPPNENFSTAKHPSSLPPCGWGRERWGGWGRMTRLVFCILSQSFPVRFRWTPTGTVGLPRSYWPSPLPYIHSSPICYILPQISYLYEIRASWKHKPRQGRRGKAGLLGKCACSPDSNSSLSARCNFQVGKHLGGPFLSTD